MPKSKIEIGSWIILFLGIYTTVISILWIFVTEIMFVSDFAAYTGHTYQQYLGIDRPVAEMYIITKKLIGVVLLVVGLIILLINRFAYSTGEKWSWYALLIAGGIPWGAFIIYKIIIGYIGLSMMTFALGAVLVIIGLAIPAKEILSK